METAAQLWKKIQSSEFNPATDMHLVEDVKKIALASVEPCKVSFGTSGFRGEIGTEFTLRTVEVIATAIIRMYKEADAELLEALGVANFEALQERGIELGHDDRLLGDEFCKAVAQVFAKAGVKKIYYGGEMATPEFSAAVELLKAACSINMTPSHNPSNYAGIKFNPADGGPAGPEITCHITRISNELMKDFKREDLEEVEMKAFDSIEVYNEFLHKQGTIQFARIQKLLDEGRLTLVCDHVHGATRKRPNVILGNPQCLMCLRTEDDPLFGGIAPEPSSKNLEGVKKILDQSKSWFRLGCIFDPDGDRVRFYDGTREIDMNRFGAIAYHYMVTWRKEQGVVAKSVATSNFVNVIANKLGAPVMETPVGFKNFRPWLARKANPKALIAFEESDGISGLNNTLEKDAQFGLLLALEIMATTGKNLGEYLEELYKEFGEFYPNRAGFEVDKSLVGDPLVAQVNAVACKAKVGTVVKIGDKEKKVREVLTLDGVKIIFEDDSWMLIRPSGTEPKVRIYTECREEAEKDAMFEAAKALFFNK